MKIQVKFTIDVDVESYALAYGIEQDQVHYYINKYVKKEGCRHLEELGLLVDAARGSA